MRTLITCAMLILSACTGIPKGVKPVNGFELNRYLGVWYEIARLDHRFERGLIDIRAEYSLNADGDVKVLNSGYDSLQGKRQYAVGKAHFVDRPDIGQLEVSFLGPFYGSYNIIDLDKTAYSYALISGPNHCYLWILSRSRELDKQILQKLISEAEAAGFETDKLIFDSHNH